MIVETSFLLLLRRGHGFGDVDAATVEHVEQHAGFGAFSVGERHARLVLSHEQLDHSLVGSESIFKEALLLLLTACDLSAQRLDGGDGLFKGLASRGELVEGAIRPGLASVLSVLLRTQPGSPKASLSARLFRKYSSACE